jgi:PhzF family phenazine biosynthesis protein
MQALAAENNQAETAFLLKTADPARFGLRWFTPAIEAPICGHATLASAHALFEELGVDVPLLTFDTLSGELTVRRVEGCSAARGWRWTFRPIRRAGSRPVRTWPRRWA